MFAAHPPNRFLPSRRVVGLSHHQPASKLPPDASPTVKPVEKAEPGRAGQRLPVKRLGIFPAGSVVCAIEFHCPQMANCGKLDLQRLKPARVGALVPYA
jgi:hypothetical protein